jgi:hypothetical protein
MYKEPAVIDRRPKKCLPERKGYAQEKKPKAQKRRCAEIEDDYQLAASTEGDEKNAESSLETRFALHDEQPWVDAMRVVGKRDRAMDHFRKALRKAKRIRRNLHKTRPSENLVVSACKSLSPSMQIHGQVSPAITANNDNPQPFESQFHCLAARPHRR